MVTDAMVTVTCEVCETKGSAGSTRELVDRGWTERVSFHDECHTCECCEFYCPRCGAPAKPPSRAELEAVEALDAFAAGGVDAQARPPAREEQLTSALGEAVLYVESMRIVPGGVRDRLRRRWRTLIGWPLP